MLFKFTDPSYQASKSPEKRLVEVGSKAIVQNLFPHKTNPDMRFKVNKALLAAGKTKNLKETVRTTLDLVTASAVKKLSSKAKSKKVSGAGRTEAKQKQRKGQENTMALKNILNAVLPAQVAMSMTAPALRFRTGRLANSAEVTNVNRGPRGGLGIDYTYMRDPYETFEPGNKQGSTLRDPRRLIGGTIRKLMAQKQISKFNLKRV
jgi:hypothetical protein